MRNVSDAYLVAITADSEQTLFAAEFGFVPPGAREGLTLLSSHFGQLWGSRLAQLNNRTYQMGGKWNTLEINRSIFGNGGEYINPGSTRQTGDWSKAQSDDRGVFTDPPYIEIKLDKPYDLIGVHLFFDDKGEEWATEVKISYYDNDFTLLEEKTFLNDVTNMPIDYPYNQVRLIRIGILSWSLPRRFAKICQVIPGQIRYFNDDNMYSFLLKEKISPFASMTMPEYTLTFANEKQEYNIINPQGLIAKLRERMEIFSNIGIVTAAGMEYVNTGNFPLFSWPSNLNEDTGAFVCRPDIAFIDKDYEADGFGTRTAAITAAAISEQANLTTPIFIDETFKNIKVNENIGDSVPLQNALSQLAIAVGGYVKFERDGTYAIKPIIYETSARRITYDNMWDKANITQATILQGVRVKYLVYQVEEIGKKGSMVSAEELVSTDNEIGRIVDISSSFTTTAEEAHRIGTIALEFFGHRLNYEIIYRGDMSIEAGDTVSIETDYGLRDVLVLEHEISYDGSEFLQGKISGVEI